MLIDTVPTLTTNKKMVENTNPTTTTPCLIPNGNGGGDEGGVGMEMEDGNKSNNGHNPTNTNVVTDAHDHPEGELQGYEEEGEGHGLSQDKGGEDNEEDEDSDSSSSSSSSWEEDEDGTLSPETDEFEELEYELGLGGGGGCGVIPEVLLNELQEILFDVGESSSSPRSSPSLSPVMFELEAIPEEEEEEEEEEGEWDSDSTLTEQQNAHAQPSYQLSQISTQNGKGKGPHQHSHSITAEQEGNTTPPPLFNPSSPTFTDPTKGSTPTQSNQDNYTPLVREQEQSLDSHQEEEEEEEKGVKVALSKDSDSSTCAINVIASEECDSNEGESGGESVTSRDSGICICSDTNNNNQPVDDIIDNHQKREIIPNSQPTQAKADSKVQDLFNSAQRISDGETSYTEQEDLGVQESKELELEEEVPSQSQSSLLVEAALRTNSESGPVSEYYVVKLLAEEQQKQLDLVNLSQLSSYESGRELSKFIEANTAGSYFSDNKEYDDVLELLEGEMHQRLSSSCSEHQHLPPKTPRERPRPVLRKPGAAVKKSGRNVTFNESLNLFYEAECQCWIHEDDYARLRQEEHLQQQYLYEQQQQFHHYHSHPHHHPFLPYDPPPMEFEDTPTLSPPEGYKDRFFPHLLEIPHEPPPPPSSSIPGSNPDVTRVSPPSPPAARRKIFLKENSNSSSTESNNNNNNSNHHQPHYPNNITNHHRGPILNGLEEEEEDGDPARGTVKSKASRFGGILRGGRLWRSNSSDSKKVSSPSEEPDVVKCSASEKNDGLDSLPNQQIPSNPGDIVMEDGMDGLGPGKVSIGTAPLRTSEQIRMAVDATLRISRSVKKSKPECSSLVEKLRWLTSMDDEDAIENQSGFATWPARDKNNGAAPIPNNTNHNNNSNRKSDAGTSTSEEFVHPHMAMRYPIAPNEAKIKQIAYTLDDIDEGLKGGESELEVFITEDGARIERIRRRYGGEDIGGDDYGFSRRPSVKGIKPKFSSTNQIFAQFTRPGADTPIPLGMEAQYENTQGGGNSVVVMTNSHYEPISAPPPPSSSSSSSEMGGTSIPPTSTSQGARVNLNYDQFTPPTSQPNNGGNNAPRPGMSTEESRSHFEMIRQSFEQGNLITYNRPHSWAVSTLPSSNPNSANSSGIPHQGMMVNGVRPNSIAMMGPQQQQLYGQQGQVQIGPGGQPMYGTVRRVPNVIGRPVFLHYGALSVEAHPNKLAQPYPAGKVPETPSPTQPQQPGAAINNIKYYGPPIRYYNPRPPVPPRSATTTLGSGLNSIDIGLERGNPEGATDEEPSIKEPYSMKV